MTIELIQKIINAIANEIYDNGPESEKQDFTVIIGDEIYHVNLGAETTWSLKECDKNDPEVPTTVEWSVVIDIVYMTIHFPTGYFEVDSDFFTKEITIS